jgi:hypothetical protein
VKVAAGLAGLCLALAGCHGGTLEGPPPGSSAGRAGTSGPSSGNAGAGGKSGGGPSAATGGGGVTGGGPGAATGGGGVIDGGAGAATGGGAVSGTGAAPGGTGGASITVDPWSSSCANSFGPSTPVSRDQLLSAGPVEFGLSAIAGEAITATLNGVPMSFSTTFYELLNDEQNALIVGYGEHGELGFSAFPLAPGSYACPSASMTYDAPGTVPLTTGACCRIEVTKVGDVGDTIEGTFSGIVIEPYGGPWINVEDGRFKVVRRAPAIDAGTETDARATD